MSNTSITALRGLVIQSVGSYIKDGGVVIEGDTIVEVGPWDQISEKYRPDIIYGSSRHMILPGFVNTHTHAVQTLFRGAADDLELLPWLENVILPGEATITAEELEASCRIGYAEMLLSGITTCNDMLTANHAREGLKAAVDSGIRGHIGKMLMDRNVPDGLLEDTQEIIQQIEELAKLFPHGERIQFSFTPRFIPTCSDELIAKTSKMAKEHNLMFHTHASENQEECTLVKKMTGKNYMHKLHELDALGNHVILAHAVWTNEEERDLLKKTGTRISHNPSSNSKLASGVAPIPEYLSMDLQVGLATDGSPATGGHDFFLEMKLASFLQKATRHNPKTLPARDAFFMATEGGARALNYSNIGRIEQGYKADIIMLHPQRPSAFPMYDPYSFIVYTAQTRDIDRVYVDGNLVVEEGKINQDLSRFYRLAEEYSQKRPFEYRSTSIE